MRHAAIAGLGARLLVALSLTAAAAPSLKAAPAARDNLVIGMSQFPDSLNPNLGAQVVQLYALGFALRPVTAYDSNGQIACLLCTDVPTIDNGLAKFEDRPDGRRGLAVTVKLRPSLQWGDGEPVTARDLAFTWRVARNPNAGFANAHPWGRADQVDVVDEHTAVLHLDRTLTSYNLWDALLPEHIEGPVYAAAAAPTDYINHTVYNRNMTTPGLWNGPYLVSGYQSNAFIELTPNPHWPGTRPGFSRIVLRLIDNTSALQANLLSGDVDMTPSGIGLSIDQSVALQAANPGRFTFIYKPQLTYEHMDVQLRNPTLKDLRVRKALMHGMDLKSIVQKLFSGHGEVARSFINGLDSHYNPDVPTYPYDPARARALLAEAGWTPGPDGVCRKDGERLRIEFSTISGNRVRELTQQVMQSQWKAVCIETVIQNQPSRSFSAQALKRREFNGLAEYASTMEVGLPPWARMSSSFIPSADNNWGGMNYGGISDPALDAAIGAAETELDPKKQQALWADIQRIYAENLYGLPLYFREDPDIVPTWLGGYTATGKEAYPPYWAETWRPR